jgi:hypothetical protein
MTTWFIYLNKNYFTYFVGLVNAGVILNKRKWINLMIYLSPIQLFILSLTYQETFFFKVFKLES